MRLAALVALLLALRLAAYAMVTGGLAGLPGHLCQWDCLWYLHIVRDGYDLAPLTAPPMEYGQADWAFFPVFPGLVWLAGRVLPLAAAGVLVANLCFAGFALLGARYLTLMRPGVDSRACLIFLFAFPYGFYFSVPYSESVYALLSVAMLYALARGRLFPASWASSVLVATRVTGFLLLPVLAWRILAPAWADWAAGRRGAALSVLGDALLPLAIAPLGLALFMAYLYGHVGDGLAFLHVQAGWQRWDGFAPLVLFKALRMLDLKHIFARDCQSLCFSALCALGALALSWRLWRQRLRAEAWVLAMTVLLAASAGALSLQRYVLANPVFLLFLFEWIWSCWPRRWFPALIAAGAVLQLYLVHLWAQAYVALV